MTTTPAAESALPLLERPGRRVHGGPRVLRRLADGQPDRPYDLFELHPMGPLIGAEIHGVDLREPVSEQVHRELHRALLEYKVIFFRDQAISREQHLAFARLWGRPENQGTLTDGDASGVVRFRKDEHNAGYENVWHADMTGRPEPAMGFVLRLLSVPPVGGDTLFADMGAAYDNLPQDVRERIDRLSAVHDFTATFARFLSEDELARRRAQFPPVTHPVVRTHPETGRRTLFVNAVFTDRIAGLDPEESERLLQYLFREVQVPEYQVRFRWRPDSIAFWDNRAVQHYAVSDYFPEPRTAERVAIAGDRPF